MKKLIPIIILSFLTACQQERLEDKQSSFELKATSSEYLTASALPVVTVSGNITTNTTWSGVIEIDGIVTVKDGATLTILPGTYIKAKPKGIAEPSGMLIINKTGKINAVGTENQPIIFTSYKLLDGSEDTIGAAGDFGGLIILGDALTNTPSTTTIEGLFGPDYYYGGTNQNHNAGILKYVRIEFGGAEIYPNTIHEINGLTLAGVGSGTTIDHIQVSYGKDDSFEFYGGNVNASNLISFAPDDDNFDFNNGYTGTITCALALADYNSTHSLSGTVNDSHGIELDNNIDGTSTALVTHPVINNLTIIGVWKSTMGEKYGNGIYVRRNGRLTLNNAVVTGYPIGIKVEGTGSVLSSGSNYNTIQVHGFITSVIGAGTAGIPMLNLSTGLSASVWGMNQPYFNEGGWNISPRNCGNFQGLWTKYNFSILE
ncbi:MULTISPECIES: hypothetical protein [Chryseobacterium]|uniref:Right handed beta helix region n=1 Tax=Chryseobacterium cucumeris TaxID=1813611 RepID=A0ABX9XBN0_9FLAO|nr:MULTISPECIES: hypothetical protein [Chryseobacterium]MDH5033911.1 hypothetical protein [Chryseobacterium cucumeris]RKE80938.1 hypothetical protein DEU39_0459 [Chryseobacterium sp. AG363]ROH94723.1 hypothetical protein EGI15_02345 [Chryseobacterium cucumeris]